MAAAPRCEIRIPISATPAFLARVHVLAASIRRFAGTLADSRIVVSVSRDLPETDLAARLPWSEALQVQWRWVDPVLWERYGIFATGLGGMTYDTDAAEVILMDADTICVGPLDELFDLVGWRLGGVPELVPPVWSAQCLDGIERSTTRFWDDLLQAADLPKGTRPLWHIHPHAPEQFGLGELQSPPYFNFGMLAAPAPLMRRLGAVAFAELDRVRAFADTVFAGQVAISLMLARTGIEAVELPLRWNLPNNADAFAAYPREAADARVIHYFQRQQFDRERDLVSAAALDAFLAREDLWAANAPIQEKLRWLRQDLGASVGGTLA
jgi:hypothetical protein